MSELNYWKIPLDKLPSKGTKYSKDTKIEFRCLTIRDLKYMAAMNDENAREIVNDILKRCLRLTDLRFEDILEIDRLTLVFYLRSNTFMLSNTYQTEFKCPYCGSKVTKTIKPGDLAVKKIDESESGSVYVNGKSIHSVLKKITDPVYKTGDPDVDIILNFTDADRRLKGDDLKEEILNLPANEFAKLLHLAEDAKCGILGYADLKCNTCFRNLRVGIDLADTALFNRVQMSTMIRNRVQVSKYCGVDLNDDTPYNEVEMTITIVNDLAEKESEAMKGGRGLPPGVMR
jgi:DNA-directed RNA polymerase subunit RPC12/RpoP